MLALPCATLEGQTLNASNDSRHGHLTPVPSAEAARRSGDITLDGRLDEAAWRDATPITEFRQIDPDEGQPGSERTEVRFLFDDGALYVGARLHDSQGSAGVRTSLVRRDAPFNSDYFEIVIDGFHDHLGRAFFQVNPSGSRFDMLGIGTSCCDEGWDPIWEASTSIDNGGWTAEIRIPLNQLRFSTDSVQTWGLQVRRWIHRRNELQQWAFWGKTESGGPSRFGHLEGLRLGRAARQLELLPYVAAKTQNLATDETDPFNGGNVQSARLGLDVRYHLSSNLTLDATINPDFGQVEADPAVVNLTAFETSFPEKRPFFIAGSGVFSFGSFSCFFCSNVSPLSAFYSRRIGRAPTGASLAHDRGVYADVPEATAILGAAKITGRTSNGFTLGLLNAVTNREVARVRLGDGTDDRQVVEPLTNYFVGRVKKDLLRGNLVVGGIATSVVRDMEPDFDSRLSRHAELVGTDFLYTWKERTYSLMGQFAFTNVSGSPEAIRARQESSARYFQRPDREAHANSGLFTNAFDPGATSMRGAGAYMRLAKDAGNWMWEAMVNTRTPGFEANDLAFLTQADYIWTNANLIRYWSQPTSWYRTFNLVVGGQQSRNFDGDLTDRQVHMWMGGMMRNFWHVSTFTILRPAALDDRMLRGGPVVQRPGGGTQSFDVSTDSRGALFWNGGASYSWNNQGGWGRSAYLNLTLRPVPSTTVSLGPSWNDSKSILQYVGAFDDPTNTAFYGRRYVLAHIDQKQLALETRLSWTFSPTMSFELYAQPLLASGDYYNFKEFDAPRQGHWSIYGRDRGTVTESDANGMVDQYTIDPDDAGPAPAFTFDNPDFNFRSLRGNAVFRWEFRPGSVMYVAWAHDRANVAPMGDFDLSRDWGGLRSALPNNVLLVKASFWMPR